MHLVVVNNYIGLVSTVQQSNDNHNENADATTVPAIQPMQRILHTFMWDCRVTFCYSNKCRTKRTYTAQCGRRSIRRCGKSILCGIPHKQRHVQHRIHSDGNHQRMRNHSNVLARYEYVTRVYFLESSEVFNPTSNVHMTQ